MGGTVLPLTHTLGAHPRWDLNVVGSLPPAPSKGNPQGFLRDRRASQSAPLDDTSGDANQAVHGLWSGGGWPGDQHAVPAPARPCGER